MNKNGFINVFYASTPQSSPPTTPRSRKPRPEKIKKIGLIPALRDSIETRNFPEAMAIIRKLEQFDKDFESLGRMSLIENQLLQLSQQIAVKNEKIKTQTVEINDLQQKLEDLLARDSQASNREESLKKEKMILAESVSKLNAKCMRIAETLAKNDIDHNRAKSNFESDSVAFRSELLNMQAEIKNLKKSNKTMLESNNSLQNLLSEAEIEKAKLIHSNQKLTMINEGYKQELENILKEADQNKIIETQQKAGKLLLNRIDQLLSTKNITNERQTKKLEKRKQAVNTFLEKVEKGVTEPGKDSAPTISKEDGIIENLSEIDHAIKRLERNLS